MAEPDTTDERVDELVARVREATGALMQGDVRRYLALRVTLVFRHEESGWRLVHRHADALVHSISMEHLSKLARGSGGAS